MNKELLNDLYRYACTLTGERDDAYDLVQKAVENYLRQKQSRWAKPVQSPKFYLMRSIRNSWLDTVRHKRLQLVVNDQLQALETVETPTLADLFMYQRDMESLMAGLSNEERELLFLWAIEEYTFQEISDLRSVPRGTLLSQMHRLKKRIIHELETREEQDRQQSKTGLWEVEV